MNQGQSCSPDIMQSLTALSGSKAQPSDPNCLIVGSRTTGDVTARTLTGSTGTLAGSTSTAGTISTTSTSSSGLPHSRHHIFEFLPRNCSITVLVDLTETSGHPFRDFVSLQHSIIICITFPKHAFHEPSSTFWTATFWTTTFWTTTFWSATFWTIGIPTPVTASLCVPAESHARTKFVTT
jgi:hypothetical protein